MNKVQAGSPNRKRFVLFVLAIVLLLAGGAAVFLGVNSFTIRAVGLISISACAYLVRISNFHSQPTLDVTIAQRPGRWMWTLGVVSFVLAGASFYYLYEDAIHGYHEVLPVYVFTGAGLACAIVWSYLISKSL
jgi:hypothetical protein